MVAPVARLAPVAVRWATAVVAGAALAATSVFGCTHAPEVGCERGCATASTCVAGRCQRDALDAHPAIENASVVRLVVPATSIAWLSARDGEDSGGLPPVYTLGERGVDAELLVRFVRDYAALGHVVEAYLVLPRSAPGERAAVDEGDGESAVLGVARVTGAWLPETARWRNRPLLNPSPHSRSRVSSALADSASRFVRFDVAALVESWRAGDRRDQGLAVVTDVPMRRGVAFATPASASAAELPAGGLPFLELYLAP